MRANLQEAEFAVVSVVHGIKNAHAAAVEAEDNFAEMHLRRLLVEARELERRIIQAREACSP